MKKIIKKIGSSSLVPYLFDVIHVIKWKSRGKTPPTPHIIKRRSIESIQKKLDVKTFIETGTYVGEMVNAQAGNFERIISIELDEALARYAKQKFSGKSHIEILQGDSGDILIRMLPNLEAPAMFWLDGHYSAGITAKGELNTPIIKELKAILNSNLPHIILIDDARCFVGKDDYPTLKEIENLIIESGKNIKMSVSNDIIFLIPC